MYKLPLKILFLWLLTATRLKQLSANAPAGSLPKLQEDLEKNSVLGSPRPKWPKGLPESPKLRLAVRFLVTVLMLKGTKLWKGRNATGYEETLSGQAKDYVDKLRSVFSSPLRGSRTLDETESNLHSKGRGTHLNQA